MEWTALNKILIYGFLLSLLLGAISVKSNFCTMGAVSDWINMGKKGRLWAWMMATGIAALGVTYLEISGVASFTSTLPPYRSPSFAWPRYLLGGLMFGIGMTLGGGCGNKTLLNIGGGSVRSLMVALVVGVMAYLMTKTTMYEVLFHTWVNPLTIDFSRFGVNQSLPSMLTMSTTPGTMVTGITGGVVGLCLIAGAVASPDFRANWNNALGGIVVGGVVIAAWYVTGGPLGKEALEAVEWMEQRPVGVGVQSFTFINPLGDTLAYLSDPGNKLLLSFGVVSVGGVLCGSLLYSVFTRRFKIGWFTSLQDFVKHVAAGILMGVGGVLSMGCTIGQGITGVSTLALGSILTLVTIIFGAALTMKIQYYQMVYDDSGFKDIVVSVLADFNLLPESWRKLECP